ncbi:cytochrome P450 [Streptomyces sp. ODS05-4]|uniref:cytochrome P450 n=1 Tax=Streptomyces sp. ODS05-4 TaxID=2944939 RepID=UPI00210D01F1|nr:cytochrome P450 [Streptomyces sp. ODS05-4]
MSAPHRRDAGASSEPAAVGDVPTLPFARPALLDLPPRYARLRADQPVAAVRTPIGDPAWLVTRYADVRALLADARLVQSPPDPATAARYSASTLLSKESFDRSDDTAGPADRLRGRRAIAGAFRARRVQALRSRVTEHAHRLLDAMEDEGPGVDLHERFAVPLSYTVICELLGIPSADREFFQYGFDQATNMYDREAAQRGHRELVAYMTDLVALKRRTRGEDLISDFVAAMEGEHALLVEEVVGLAIGLLFAGHNPLMSRIDLGTVLLLTHPEQTAALRADPALMPGAVEEVLRRAAPRAADELRRYAAEDLVVGGVRIAANDLVLLSLQAANHDPEVYSDPDRFDIRRGGPDHVAFGYGMTFCMGAMLARLELEVALGALFDRFPALALAVPLASLGLRFDRLSGGVLALPVTW